MFLFSPVGGGFFNTMIVIISMNGLFKICLISRKPYNTASVVCPGMVSCTPAFFTYLRYIQKISKAIVNCHLFPFSISSFHFHQFPSFSIYLSQFLPIQGMRCHDFSPSPEGPESTLQAGGSFEATWTMEAGHPGDCYFYLSPLVIK